MKNQHLQGFTAIIACLLISWNANSQNLGIGDADFTPSTTLHLKNASSSAGLLIQNNSGDPTLQFNIGAGAGTNIISMGIDDSDGDKFIIGTTGITTNPRFSIDASGNVGIGTSSPGSLFDIEGDGAMITLPRKSTTGDPGSASNGMIYYNTADGVFRGYQGGSWTNLITSPAGGVYSGSSSLTTNTTVTQSTYNLIFNLDNTGDFSIQDAGTDFFTATDGGLIGIGTTGPSTLLDIENDGDDATPSLELNQSGTSGDASMRFITNGGNTFTLGIDGSDNDYFKISDNGTLGSGDRMVVTTNGDIGIGTNGPSTLLDLETADNDATPAVEVNQSGTDGDASVRFITNGGETFTLGIDGSDNDFFKISDNGTLGSGDRMVVNNSGLVGFNNSSPSYQVDVANSTVARTINATNTFNSASATYAIYGANTSTGSGDKVGVLGIGTSNSDAYGIQGIADGAGGDRYGVYGKAEGAGAGPATTYGVYGINTATPGASSTAYGGYFETSGSVTTGIGGYFKATGATNNYALIVPPSSGNVGIGTTSPNTSAIVEMVSTAAGLLIPRMNSGERTSIGTPATGLLVYQTDATAGFYFYNGSGWDLLKTGSAEFSDGGENGTAARSLGNADNYDLSFLTNNSSRLMIEAAGDVGIGDDTPDAHLEVSADGGSGGDIFNLSSTDANDGDLMTVQEDGKVGIGTNNPAAILDVTGTDAIILPVGTSLQRPGTPENGMLRYNADNSDLEFYNGSWTALPTTASAFSDGGENGTAARSLGNTDNYDLSFLTNNSSRIMIEAGGDVGMGDDTPDAHLEISADGGTGGDIFNLSSNDANDGDILTVQEDGMVGIGTKLPKSLLHLNSTASPQLSITHTTAADSATFGVDANGALTFTTVDGGGTSGHINLIPDGNVGIGTSTPTVLFDIEGNTSNTTPLFEMNQTNINGDNSIRMITSGGDTYTFGIDASDGDKFKISDAGQLGSNDRFIIDVSGFVGIGQATPTSTLHVYDNTSGDKAMLQLEQNHTTGDASLKMSTNGGNTYTIGIDESDVDKFKISDHTALGTNDRLVLNPSGFFGLGGVTAPESVLHLDGEITLEEQAANPFAPAADGATKIYIKDDKLIIFYNHSGTAKYRYIDLTGTDSNWNYTTTAP